jgi:hypothetical protein
MNKSFSKAKSYKKIFLKSGKKAPASAIIDMPTKVATSGESATNGYPLYPFAQT